MIELLVVIGIIAILAAILLPALAKAKQRGLASNCMNNNRQIAVGILMYATDNGDRLPSLNTGTYPAVTTNWYFRIMDNGRYLTASSTTNNLWRCPAVQDADINPGTVAYFKSPCEGYGPLEGNDYTNGVIRYPTDNAGNYLDSRKLSQIKRTSSIWLLGDVGAPKAGGVDKLPTAYYTDITTEQPVPGTGWTTAPSNKQPACRHNGRAIFSFCDGHVEMWKWEDLRGDKKDVFALQSY